MKQVLALIAVIGLSAACSNGSGSTGPGSDGSDAVTGDASGDTGACTPSCDDKECGDDGCGGSCGTCEGELTCSPAGVCTDCVPFCTNRACGDDGCGGSCGECQDDETCTPAGQCQAPCVPDCAGKVCGGDGCGGSCGSCDIGTSCNNQGQCVAGGVCDKVSGPNQGDPASCTESDPCLCVGCVDDGTCDPNNDDCICADCAADSFCADPSNCNNDGSCDPYSEGCGCADCATHPNCGCTPSCDGKTCGADGCGGTCGSCGAGEFCDGGSCAECTCDGKVCGDDGCGTSCGVCEGANDICSWEFMCVDTSGLTCEQVSSPNGGDDPGACTATNPCQCLGCTNDGTCNVEGDDCVCPDCATDSFCASANACDDNGSCDPYSEGCGCADCADHPLCPPCEPQCTGKSCGADGCGGVCGTCGDSEVCTDTFQCAEAAEGDICSKALPVTGLPFTDEGDTAPLFDANATDGTCGNGDQPGNGANGSDVFYEFTPPQDATYIFGVFPSGAGGFPTIIALYTGCTGSQASTCAGFSGDLYGGGEGGEWSVSLTGGTTYYVVLDALFANDDVGPYTFTISEPCIPACEGKVCGTDGCGGTCGDCGEETLCNPDGACVDPSTVPGNTCALALPISAGGSASGDTTNSTDTQTVSGCPGVAGEFGEGIGDQWYAFTPATDGVYTVELDSTYNSAFAIWSGSCAAPTCLVGSESSSGAFVATAGTTYLIQVDGFEDTLFGGPTEGEYTLSISEACIPACDGKQCGDNGCNAGDCGTCADGAICTEAQQCNDVSGTQGNACVNPFAVDSLPFTTTSDNTTGFDNNYSTPSGACGGAPGLGDEAPDQAYAWTAASDGFITVTVDPTDDEGDHVVYVTTDCTDFGAGCQAAGDGIPPDSDTASLAVTAGTTYYVIVDGYSTDDNGGPYTLTIQTCTPDCAGKACGTNGCGGTCGECTGGQICVEEETGATCQAP